MSYFYEPANLTQWDMFEKVTRLCHVEPFPATKAMGVGDVVFLHVGAQDKFREPGIYAIGVVRGDPYVFEADPDDRCYGRLSVDVMIMSLSKGAPFVDHETAKGYINQFRSVHMLDSEKGERLFALADAKLGIREA